MVILSFGLSLGNESVCLFLWSDNSCIITYGLPTSDSVGKLPR